MCSHNPVQQIYDQLWATAITRFKQGQVQTDPYLRQPETDRRQGISLIARPQAGVAAQFTALVNELRDLEPEQYFYQPDEFHITVITLVSASETFAGPKMPVATYYSIFTSLFKQIHPFSLTFRGITASPGAVLVQGFVDGDYLNWLRGVIRRELQQAGLAETLDVRYKIMTAHVTLMRFKSPPRDWPLLLAKLTEARQRNFGSSEVTQIEFVVNDWYMSRDKVQVLTTYPLNHQF